MEQFEKFIQLCRSHAHIGIPNDEKNGKLEDKIIHQIRAEGLRLIKGGKAFEALLKNDDDYIRFWCAMSCVERKYSAESGVQVLREVAKLDNLFTISSRAMLVLWMYDNGTLYDSI